MLALLEKLYLGLRSLGEAIAAPLGVPGSVGSVFSPVKAPEPPDGDGYLVLTPGEEGYDADLYGEVDE